MSDNSDDIEDLVRQSRGEERQLFCELLSQHRDRLRRAVSLRMDVRLRGRVDPSDVIQEAYLEATHRLEEFLDAREVPFFVWLRFITMQKLMQVHRRHLQTQSRDAGREISLDHRPGALIDSSGPTLQLPASLSGPGDSLVRQQRRRNLDAALSQLAANDREVIALRHFEELSNSETAHVLGIKPAAATLRLKRALERMRHVLQGMPGAIEEP